MRLLKKRNKNYPLTISNISHFSGVYFIQVMNNDGFIKIGKSQNIKARLKQLQSVSPYRLKIIATTLGSESDIHALFQKSKTRLEWYEPTSDLLAFISNLNKK